MMPIFILHKFGQYWNLLLKEYMRGFTYQGILITFLGRGGASSSRVDDHVPRPVQASIGPRVSFFDEFIFPRG